MTASNLKPGIPDRISEPTATSAANRKSPWCLALLPTGPARDLLRAAIASEFGPRERVWALAFCNSRDDFLRYAVRTSPQLAVVGCGHPRETVRVLDQLGSVLPRTALVAWLDGERQYAQELMRCFQSGIHGLVIEGENDDTQSIGEVLDHALSYSVVKSVGHALNIIAPPFLSLYLVRLLKACRGPLSPSEAADLRIAHVNTLRRDLGSCNLPPVNKLIVWFRLFHAIHLLEDSRRTIENVALVLGFASRTSLTSQVTRYCGCRIQSLRREGALAAAIEEFVRRQRAGHWGLNYGKPGGQLVSVLQGEGRDVM